MIINGTSGSDSIIGTYQDNIVNGGRGLDMMWGYQGNDTFVYNPRDFTPNGIDIVVTGGDGTDTNLLKTNHTTHYNFSDLHSSGMDEIEVLSFDGNTPGIRVKVTVDPSFLLGLGSLPRRQDLTTSGSSQPDVRDVFSIILSATSVPFPRNNLSYLQFEN